MKKTSCLWFMLTIAIIFMFVSCQEDGGYKRNEKYTYGALADTDSIDSVYELVGSPSLSIIDDYTGEWGAGSVGTYKMEICETADGGVVAYGEGIYVYSPDKEDKNSVRSAFISECKYKNKNIKN